MSAEPSDAHIIADAPSCSDCAHCSHGWCRRSVGKHFDVGSNGYRSRLDVSCANERGSDRTLTRRWRCGPVGRYFEHKAMALPMVPRHDTVGDSDGDDGA
jgi:hypothetical protein